MSEPALNGVWIEVWAQREVAADLVEDPGRPVRPEQPTGGHRGQEVGYLDPVEDVGVEDDDVTGHVLVSGLRVVETQLLGFRRHRIQRLGSVAVHPVPVGEDVGEPKPTVGADQVVSEGAGLELFDEEGAAHVEQVGCLDRRELGVHRDHRHTIAGLEVLDDRDQ